jgi:protein involved in polysaccharide export with SLBB domain
MHWHSTSRNLVGLVALLGASCTADRPLPEPTAAHSSLSTALPWDDIKLGPGDLVRVGVHGHPELSTPIVATPSGTRIGTDGALSLPLAGTVHVAGLSIADARTAITAAYAQYLKNPRIDASVVEFSARRFYLYGEVTKPGTYVLDRPMTLYQALALGGGYTAAARRDKIVLLRGTPENLEVEVFDGESPDAKGFYAIQPDDLVFVRRSGVGKFTDEVLPILSGIGSALSSVATVILIEDKLKE